MPDSNCYVISDTAGLYEALIDLNSPVRVGDVVGQVHFPRNPELLPVVYRAERPGILIGRAHKVLIESGDFLALIATEM